MENIIRNTWNRAKAWFKKDKPQDFVKPEISMPRSKSLIEPRVNRIRYKRPHRYHRSIDRPIW